MSGDGIDSSDSSSSIIAPIILLLLCILFVTCINCIIKCCKGNCSENPNTYSNNHALRNQQLIPNLYRLVEQQHSSNLDYQRNQSNRSRTPKNQSAIDSHRETLVQGTAEVVAPSLGLFLLYFKDIQA